MTKVHSESRKDQQMFHALQTQGSEALEQLYVTYRPPFIAYARKYNASEEDILDVYQDAIIAFFENIQEGKIKNLTSSIKTYLFSIGKNKLIDKIKRNNKEIHLESFEQVEESVDNSVEDHLELSHRQTLLRKAINQLGGSCKEILLLFYYRQYSIEAIQLEKGFKNINTVKAHKSRCMKNLRNIIRQKEIY